MSWLYSRALVEAYLPEKCLDGEPSAQSNGNPTQLVCLPPDKMTDFSRLSRFGMTFKPLTADRGEELLTLYLEDFPVRTLALQGKEQESTGNGQECGNTWRGSLAKFDPDSRSWRTAQCSVLGGLEPFLETWPRWGLMRNGECWEQQTLAHPISATESGSSQQTWPTPTATFNNPATGEKLEKRIKTRKNPSYLSEAVKWPTPLAQEAKHGKVTEWELTTNHASTKASLRVAVAKASFPTPCASDHRDRGNMSQPSVQRRALIGKQLGLSMVVDPNSGQLNPTWVEWLMGWPLEWTDLKPLETDKFPNAPQPHGVS
jgi:hypothetical protein